MLSDTEGSGLYLGHATLVGDKVYFQGQTDAAGGELWVSDGTEAGTRIVQDLWPGSQSSNPRYLANVGGRLFFNASTPTTGSEAWRLTSSGAMELVADARTGTSSSNPRSFAYFEGYCYFAGSTDSNGSELLRVELKPEVAGTMPVSGSGAVPADTDITISLGDDVDASTVDSDSFIVVGEFSGKRSGTIVVNGKDITFTPNSDFLPGETVEVILTSGIMNTGGVAIGKSTVFRFRIAAGMGPGIFDQSIASSVGGQQSQTQAIASGDLDGDGDLDLVFAINGEQS